MSTSPIPGFTSILVPMDVLLDTRLGTIDKLGGADLVLEVLKGNYHKRQDDKFPAVNVDAYNAMYASRDEETLSRSYSTNIEMFLRDLVHSLIKQALVRPFHSGVRVVINTYPYQLSDEITQQVMAAVVTKLIGDIEIDIPLTVVAEHLSDEMLTPEFCKSNFAAMLMYDYTNWLSLQQQALLKKPMPEVTLYAPALYFDHTPTEEEIKQLQNEFNFSPFEVFRRSVCPAIDLQLLPIDLFSIVKPV